MKKDDVALRIGTTVLDAIKTMQEKKEPLGRSIVIPINVSDLIPDGQESWLTSVEIQTPFFVEVYLEGEERKFRTVTLDEFYGWKIRKQDES